MSEAITLENGAIKAPSKVSIVKIVGDGVGPEIWRASQAALEQAAKLEGREIVWREFLAGEAAFKETGSPLPAETLAALKSCRVGLKGPLGTPIGGGLRSLNVAIRQALDLYACVRPIKPMPFVPSPVKDPSSLDILLFRENTEDVYAGLEWSAQSPEAKKLIAFLREELGVKIDSDAALGLKPMTKNGSQKLIRAALLWALKEKRPSLTLVHKGNIMKYTEGAFRQWGYDLAAEEFGEQTLPESKLDPNRPNARLIIKDCLADNMFMQVLTRPGDFSVVATPNLNGDYLSDALAAQIGGLGVAPGANLGDGIGVFEATHGTVPKRAGLDMVNPSSLLLSGALMFDWLGWASSAQRLRAAIAQTVADRILTYDLARQANLKPVSCSDFGAAVLARL
ncbi:MAG: NADP-dependent isocitrate dehydrogenase [Deltaproteobacteria bacterium]|jgi:isocitrate dehydrogenase|nr:NADP-dependent isocitrate dehydrogenase [Deltaproteobacteria bacterium]